MPVIAFPPLIALGLLLAKSEQVPQALQWLSPLTALAAMPLLSAGILLWQRPGTDVVGLRLTGSSLAVASVGVLIAGCCLAWPVPAPMIALALFSFAFLTVTAIYLRVPDARQHRTGRRA